MEETVEVDPCEMSVMADVLLDAAAVLEWCADEREWRGVRCAAEAVRRVAEKLGEAGE